MVLVVAGDGGPVDEVPPAVVDGAVSAGTGGTVAVVGRVSADAVAGVVCTGRLVDVLGGTTTYRTGGGGSGRKAMKAARVARNAASRPAVERRTRQGISPRPRVRC